MVPGRSKALSVRRNVKTASRSSSSSSRTSLPPLGIQRVGSSGGASHRGQGSFPQDVSMTRMDVQVDIDNVEQRSKHVEQTYHDHRTLQLTTVECFERSC